MKHILLVEDDASIIENLTEYLKSEGYAVSYVSGQSEAIDYMENGECDLVLLDVALNNGNGFSVCSYIKKNTDIPVIFLTASDDEYSVVTGLDMGADDYIGKPFRPRELISRIQNVLRRYGRTESVLQAGDITVDPAKAVVRKSGEELFLSALEYRLLLFFIHNRGAVISRDRLLSEIWDVSGDYVTDNTLTVYIKRLREKIEEDPQEPKMIQTVRGLGYRMD